eukprot:CAMPEP_0174911550 /NCGR_PEP_ID=MMETSP0167-20121228/77155_1 /TAXON_ID=38298 /ORGANISM="Rhodella maculata, Strain CCMP736" /LENGTH=52 /DNA_ID=CAMNT_0016156073 /DNA_START=66 /DNA_END=224 /DNA_ORIENTATION=+
MKFPPMLQLQPPSSALRSRPESFVDFVNCPRLSLVLYLAGRQQPRKGEAEPM